ncbi:S-layer homology domain-containing protein [Solibacillus sp. FSL K6-4121]|uniref:S-layer homology domain-containing protein n=1 Tax=Solibacillus sp. FSL K6-4121 TaxID=2921505 RepID=UPI0030FA816B
MKKQTYKKMFNVALTTTLAAGAVVAVAPQADAALSFKDVKETNTHYANIMDLAERGIIKGYEDGTFRPGDSIKRGNAAHIIASIIGLDTTNVTNPNFKDISTKNSNYGAIAALANAGIINGFEDGTYRANDNLTRGQMAKIIANAFKLTSNGEALPFTDIQNSQYKENIAALFSNNVTTGVTATTFDAKSNVTRGQLSSFVVRAEKASAAPTPEEPTTEEGVFTVGSVVGNTVTIAGEQFEVTPELADVFNADNAAALQDSVVTLVIEYAPETVASTTPMFAKGKGKITGIKALKLVKENTSFNPKGFKIAKVEAAAKGLTLTDVKADSLEIPAGINVTISGGEITNLVVANGAAVTLTDTAVEKLQVKGEGKITLGEGTTLKTVVLEKGKTLADVIANYDAVKDQLTNVKIEESSTVTPPAAGGGGGGGGGSTPPAPPTLTAEQQEYVKTLKTKLTALEVPGVNVDTSTGSAVTITASPSITKEQLENASSSVINSFFGSGTTGILESVKINTATYTSEDEPLNNIKAVAANLALAIGIDVGEAVEIADQAATASIWDKLSGTSYKGDIILTFKDGNSSSVTINLEKGQ